MLAATQTIPHSPNMLKRSARLFSTTLTRPAELSKQLDHGNAYGVHVSKAQGHVNGLVGGTIDVLAGPELPY